MTKGEKLSKFIDHLNMSKSSFATSIGVSSTVINGIVNNSHNAGHKVLAGIGRKYPQFNVDWFMFDKGEMLLTTEVNEPEKDYLQNYLINLEEQFKRLLNQLEKKDQQLETKDSQIQSLQEMLKMTLGKLDLGEDITCPVYDLNFKSAA